MSKQFLLSLLALASLVSSAAAAEICGNGIDDDSNGLVDEGCYPSLTTGQCESPLSCADTGDVSPRTGSLRSTSTGNARRAGCRASRRRWRLR